MVNGRDHYGQKTRRVRLEKGIWDDAWTSCDNGGADVLRLLLSVLDGDFSLSQAWGDACVHPPYLELICPPTYNQTRGKQNLKTSSVPAGVEFALASFLLVESDPRCLVEQSGPAVNSVVDQSCCGWSKRTASYQGGIVKFGVEMVRLSEFPRGTIDLYTFNISDLQTRTKVTCLNSKASLGESPDGIEDGHLKPFGCQVTILNTSDHLGKFEGKADEGYLVGYAPNSKAYRGIGHEWYFDLDYLTDSLGYTRFKTDKPAGTQETNINAGTQDHDSDSEVDEQVIVVPSFPSNSFCSQAEAEIRNQGVSADRDPAGIDSAGGVSAGSDPAGGNPAGHFQTAGSYEPADQGNPASLVSTSVLMTSFLDKLSSGIFSHSSLFMID
ncbi:hypothetical protein Tco_1553831 [Tanacetum coccineum]